MLRALTPAIAMVLLLLAPGARAQPAEPVPKAELQQLSEVVRLIKRDFARATDDAVLASGCAESLADAAHTSERAARTLEALPPLLIRAQAAPGNKHDFRKLAQACIKGMVAMLDTYSQYLDEAEMREMYRRPRERAPEQTTSASWGAGEVLELRISRFSERTRDDLQRDIGKLAEGREPRGLVLDLRDNSGGLLRAAIEVSGLFLEDGVPVGATRGRGGRLIQDYRASERGRPVFPAATPLPERVAAALRRAPLAVLVNKRTASGAEILAAALQAGGRGVIIGEPTLGLGSIQTVFPLGSGAALRLTSAYWHGPKDVELEGRPLEPDFPAADAAAPPAARRWVSEARTAR